jgi:hypothetical protein
VSIWTNIAGYVTDLTDPLAGLGSELAAGLDSFAVGFLNELWHAIVAPIAIGAGVILLFIAFALFFKDDIMGAVRLAGSLGMFA